MLFPVDPRQVRLYRPLPVGNLLSIKMPQCDECNGDGYKDGYICSSCKGKGTVEALARVPVLSGLSLMMKCEIYDGTLRCPPSCRRHRYSPVSDL
ncbi:hypothetical protein DL95DRAFT_397998 [Leptodontidium sp. 2 PMI_412]|nr:hypothetical protein DL95DRAFT_397998 [Leptodontidium sp. 2 PMI_412]